MNEKNLQITNLYKLNQVHHIIMIPASPKMEKYFSNIKKNVKSTYDFATLARQKGFDATDQVDVRLAENLAERVIGLISIIEPRIETCGAVARIIELEKQYGSQDWRVAMTIALEIAQNKFVKFDDKLAAIEIGVRVGFAYVTVGVVSSPLEGFTGIELKKTAKGEEYFSLRFAGPIRNAGGTAAAVSVIIADYVRKHLGFARYDPDNKEVSRIYTEIMDYHDKVTNLQYVPSEEESNFLTQNLPVEIDGDPSEKFEVSNYKDLPRVAANRIRSGVCLIHSSCLPLKAKKLWKNLDKWLEEMGMEEWGFMKEFLAIQKAATSKSINTDGENPIKKTAEEEHIVPNYTYIKDLVGGRPIISHPLREGGLRLRYGRSRTSGMSAQSLHPATMHVMDNFIAVGTQLKVERPGKATTVTSCDTIEGPIVELDTGEVLQINDADEAIRLANQVVKIHYLGDVLINYGDFFDRAATLLPPGYCEEWWILELEKAVCEKHGVEEITDIVLSKIEAELKGDVPSLTTSYLQELFADAITTKVKPSLAVLFSKKYSVPLHPAYTLHYKRLTLEQSGLFLKALSRATQITETNKTITEKTMFSYSSELKEICCFLGLPHKKAGDEFIVIDKKYSYVLEQTFNYTNTNQVQNLIDQIPKYQQLENENPRVKQSLFTLIQSQKHLLLRDKSGISVGSRMGRPEKAKMRKHAGRAWTMAPQEEVSVDKETGEKKTRIITEHNMKPQLREAFEIHANKDGTIRYDGSEVPITHFRPAEVGTSVEKLVSLGYTHDTKGAELTNENQIVELYPQDVIIPCCAESPNEPADEVLFRTTRFIDTLLDKLYGLKPFYNLKTKSELAGQYVFGLAPHTSAATVGRIVGFTKTQGLFCHPMFHAAMRRDCDGDETCVFLLMDGFLNFSTKFLPKHRGGTMDAPLVLTSIMNPMEVDDMVFNMDLAWKYPLEFYEACCDFKKPWDVKIPLLNDVLNTPKQFEGMGYTHETSDFNKGVLCSAYKTLPSMKLKVDGSMALAEKIAAADEVDMAEIVIKKHFISDIAGNLRKFTLQEFRCTKCGTKYRRPPLRGRCTTCGNPKLIFTIHQASVTKYLGLSTDLAEKYDISPYTKQVIELLQMRCESLFGREKEKQTGLGEFFS